MILLDDVGENYQRHIASEMIWKKKKRKYSTWLLIDLGGLPKY